MTGQRRIRSAELLAIGTEITVGETRDTNSGELARALVEAGSFGAWARGPIHALSAQIVAALHAFEKRTLDTSSGHLWRLCVLPWQRHSVVQHNQKAAKAAIKALTLSKGWSNATGLAKYQAAKTQIAKYAESVQRAAQYQTFERLFSL